MLAYVSENYNSVKMISGVHICWLLLDISVHFLLFKIVTYLIEHSMS